MTKKTKTILLSTMTLMLCVLLISTASFALYTSSTTIYNHLEAGKLEIGLWRVGVQQCTLDPEGYLKVVNREQGEMTPSGRDVYQDFTGLVNDNFFGLTGESLNAIVPGTWFETTLKVVNSGDVAFNYSVNFARVTASDALLEKIIVTVTPCDAKGNPIGTAVEKKMVELVSNGATISRAMVSNATEEYLKVRVAFSDSIVNELDDSGVNFDLVIKADQVAPQP